MTRKKLICFLDVVWMFLLPACSPDDLVASSPQDAGLPPDGGAGGSGGGSGEMPCPAGHAPNGDGACQPIGIQGCAARFIDADGVCRPSMARCADQPGTIPRFKEGCVAVGILDCAPEFIEEDGLCHPRMEKCASQPGTFAVPQLGCVPIDGPLGCGSGTWGNIADGPDTLYVDPSYPGAGSDGTKAQPFKTISEAMAVVPAGGRVALATGTYAEPVLITKAMTLEGRCPSMVKITSKDDVYAVIDVVGAADVTLRGFEVGGGGMGISADDAPGLFIERVHVREATDAGIQLTGGLTTAAISSSLVESTIPALSPNERGGGVEVGNIASLSLTHSAIINNSMFGVRIMGDAVQAELFGDLIEGTLSQPSTLVLGYGLQLYNGASASLEGSALVRNRESGFIARHEGTHGELRYNLIESTLPEEGDEKDRGYGVWVDNGAVFKLEGNAVLHNHDAALLVRDESIVETSGNLFAYTDALPDNQRTGFGLHTRDMTQVVLVGDVFYQNRVAGIVAYAFFPSVTATRLLIEQTQPSPYSGQDGVGVGLIFSPILTTLESCAIVGNTVGGVIAWSSHVIISNSLISGTKAGSVKDPDKMVHKDFGDGLIAVSNSDVTIDRTIVEQVERGGLVFDQSKGAITACESRGNRYGVVIQRTPEPTFAPEQSSVHDNQVEDLVSDGDLAVPSEIPAGF